MTWVSDCDFLEEAAGFPGGSSKIATRWLAIDPFLATAAIEEHLPVSLLTSIAYTESRFSPSAISKAGAQGVMQLMPVTGKAMAKSVGIPYEPFNAETNIILGAHYLRRLIDYYEKRGQTNMDWVIAAYFAGPGNVNKRGPSAYRDYVMFVQAAKQAYFATQTRCEGMGAGDVPEWPSGSKKKNGKKKIAKKKPKKKTKRGGRNGSGLVLGALVVLGIVMAVKE